MLPWYLWVVPWFLTASVGGDVHAGQTLSIFSSFGDLGELVDLGHHEDHWYLDFHSTDVFDEVMEIRRPFLSPDDTQFNGEFLLQLCDNLGQLKAALFRGHKVEGLEKPWRAYTGGWSKNTAAIHLGINSSYLVGAHGYALVRLARHHERVIISPEFELHLNQLAEEGASKLIPEQPETVFDFIQNFGTHYVSSYTSGDSLYQVFVFAPTVYEDLLKTMREYEETGQGLEQVLEYFTPWHVEHFGRITSLSRNSSMELWAEEHLQSHMLVFVYSSLLKLHSTPELLKTLNVLLGNDALLSVELKSLAPFISDSRKRLWYTEVLDNHMKLWEISV